MKHTDAFLSRQWKALAAAVLLRCRSMIMSYPELIGFKKCTLSLTGTSNNNSGAIGIAPE
jgi:hypothetical protein